MPWVPLKRTVQSLRVPENCVKYSCAVPEPPYSKVTLRSAVAASEAESLKVTVPQ